MVHRGDILESAVRKSKKKITQIAAYLGVQRKTVYSYFSNAEVPLDTIIEIGKFIDHDFSSEIPELSKTNTVAETQAIYNTPLNDCRQELEAYKGKYESLAEKYFGVLEEYNKLLKQIQLPVVQTQTVT